MDTSNMVLTKSIIGGGKKSGGKKNCPNKKKDCQKKKGCKWVKKVGCRKYGWKLTCPKPQAYKTKKEGSRLNGYETDIVTRQRYVLRWWKLHKDNIRNKAYPHECLDAVASSVEKVSSKTQKAIKLKKELEKTISNLDSGVKVSNKKIMALHTKAINLIVEHEARKKLSLKAIMDSSKKLIENKKLTKTDQLNLDKFVALADKKRPGVINMATQRLTSDGWFKTKK